MHDFDYHQPEKPNTGDKISEALDEAANLTESLNQSGLKTGNAGFLSGLAPSLLASVPICLGAKITDDDRGSGR